ncbi:MAG: adenylate/guanylate cyclase domain-containing protein [Actinomycetia bacterium]|nr:adenylate/guanylate cyclase domain-containing protein [Actinomycetes bacterium]
MADPRLHEHLVSLGATPEELAAVDDEGGLISLAGDLTLSRGLDLTLDELAARCRVSAEQVRSLYAALGLDVERLSGFGEGDVDLVTLTMADGTGLIDLVGAELFRVVGRSLRRIAETAVAAYVQDVESPPDEHGADLVGLAELNQIASGLAVDLGTALGPVFRHHLWVTVRDQRAGQDGVGPAQLIRAGIGFVDLVGFTPMAEELSPTDLMALVESFERRAHEVATGRGGQIVKSIGDEVMIAAPDHETVADIALTLVQGFGESAATRPRGGISAGEVVFRLGDFYGPIVNRASRLVDTAEPGEVLTDIGPTASGGVPLRPVGTRQLKGFSNPVDAWAVEPGR